MKKIIVFSILAILLVPIASIAISILPVPQVAKDRAVAINEGGGLVPPGLQRVIFIHYKKNFAKPPWAGVNGDECYAFLGKGVKWKELPISYAIDPQNPQGLSQEFITSAIYAGAEEWDNHTSSELFSDTYAIIYDGSFDTDAPDGRNEILFGNYPKEGVIAVTVVWGYFYGPPSERKIVEFDIMLDTDWAWGDATLDSTVMDLQNIVTHELGHGVGLDDVYATECSEVTMYGYSNYGEIKKRTLEQSDITGLQALYGT